MVRRLALTGSVAVLLFSGTMVPAQEPPTFSNEVVRILQSRCQTCHRPGEHAPFPLLTYRDAYEKRDDIRDAVRGRVMPPWKPVPGLGDFAEPRRLTDAELATFANWITYLDGGSTAEALDRLDPGPGYSCFGGPGFVPVGGLSGWAPGTPSAHPHRRLGLRLAGELHVHQAGSVAGRDPDRHGRGLRQRRREPPPAEPPAPPRELGRGDDRRDGDRLRRLHVRRRAHRLAP
jgi:hypothetical protein